MLRKCPAAASCIKLFASCIKPFISALEFRFVSGTNHFTENNLSQHNTFQYLFKKQIVLCMLVISHAYFVQDFLLAQTKITESGMPSCGKG